MYNDFVLAIKSLGLDQAKWIVDVGANHGDFAQAASTIFPDAHVLLIEPIPTLQGELKNRSATFARWSVEPCAAAAAAGTAELVIDPEYDDIASLAGFAEDYLRARPSVRPTKKIECNVKTLDQIFAERGISAVDLIKIDVEGFEFDVLQGLEKTLPCVRAIIVEVSLVRSPKGDNDPLTSMISRLTKNGFSVTAVQPSLYDASESWRPVEFNILARRGAEVTGVS